MIVEVKGDNCCASDAGSTTMNAHDDVRSMFTNTTQHWLLASFRLKFSSRSESQPLVTLHSPTLAQHTPPAR